MNTHVTRLICAMWGIPHLTFTYIFHM